MTYICFNCGQVFDYPREYRDAAVECWGHPTWTTYNGCPRCESSIYRQQEREVDDGQSDNGDNSGADPRRLAGAETA